MKLETGRILIFSILSNSGKFLNLCGIHYIFYSNVCLGLYGALVGEMLGWGAEHAKVWSRCRGWGLGSHQVTTSLPPSSFVSPTDCLHQVAFVERVLRLEKF